jgi:extracellular elastinolytic metalloproteinase
MGREIDRRQREVGPVTPARENELRTIAESVSRSLPGDHELRIERFDAETGNPAAVASALAPPVRDNHIQRAMDHLASINRVLGLAPSQPVEYTPDPRVQQSSSGAKAVHCQQLYKAIPIFQAAQAVRFAPDDRLTETVGTTITVPEEVPVAPRLSVQEAVRKAAEHVAEPQPDEQGRSDQFGEPIPTPRIDLTGFTPRVQATFPDKADRPTVLDAGPLAEPIKASLVWFPLAEQDLRLGWGVTTTFPGPSAQFYTIVDAETGEILYCKDLMVWVAARGNVFVRDGASRRQPLDFPVALDLLGLPDPGDLPAGFPDTWVESDSTLGNAVRAHLGDAGPVLAGAVQGALVSFDSPTETSDDQKVLNIFYFNCFMHDFFYVLGFRERDGNFQHNNLGRGGAPGDRVDARAHSGAVIGTANMLTPADGSGPTMNMGMVTSTSRHTAFDAGVVFHEYMHGVTNRLVGGPADAFALQQPQSRGMGEGWGDYIACTILGTDVVGSWVVNNPRGIRGFPYDSSFPDHFGNLGSGRYTEEHNIGEIWCATLLELNRRMDAALGAPTGKHLVVQLVVDALKISPANPSFLAMRDAILRALDDKRDAGQVDAARHATARHTLLEVFARFGMGPAARTIGASLSGIVADFTGPSAPPPVPPPAGADLRVEEAPNAAIPDDQPDGVTRTLTVAAAGRVKRVTVSIDIQHPFIGDLRVSLIPPGGAPIALHNRVGGAKDDLVQSYPSRDVPALAALAGRQVGGNWTLKVEDLARRDIGTLRRWALEIGVESTPRTVRAETSPGLNIPDDTPAGISSTLAVAESGTLQAARVGVNISHTFIGDLRVELVPPSGPRVLLHDRTGGGADNLVSTFDSVTNPALAGLIGRPIQGNWTLNVSDHAGVDVGRLNQWRLELTASA